MFGTNYKTTMGGIGAILTALGSAAHGFSTGDMPEVYASIPSLVTGIGLLMAKDNNVTGGSVGQTDEAKIRVIAPEVITNSVVPLNQGPPSREDRAPGLPLKRPNF
jgi:hypothetical protein